MSDACPKSRLLKPEDHAHNKTSLESPTDSKLKPLSTGGIQLSASKNNLDAILQDMLDAEDQPNQIVANDETSNACSDMSSLLPFSYIIPSDCEESIATGPPNSDNNISEDENKNLCPDQVYIDANNNSTAYGSYFFHRRRSSDQSLSSNESNSLSSILDSIGWSSRKKNTHHSRGLNKKKGMLYKFLASNKESAHHERENSHRQAEGHEKSLVKAAGIVFVLVCFVGILQDFAAERDDMKDRIIENPAYKEITDGYSGWDSSTIDEGYKGGLGSNMAIAGIPRDERPDHAIEHFDSLPKDETGKISNQVKVPDTLSFIADPTSAIDVKLDSPLFWLVPKSGAQFIRKVMSSCHSLTLASEYGAEFSGDKDLRIIHNGDLKYVNVETFTATGIARAKQLGLVQSNMADVIITPLFMESLQMFNTTYRARAFTLIRHPIDRAVSMFEKYKKENPGVKVNLLSYARSRNVENNYLVRYLSGEIEGDIDEENLLIAQEVLKKFVIGLTEDMEKSTERFDRYFGFTGSATCRRKIIKGKGMKQKIKEDSEAWELLMWQNKLDFKLYQYARELYIRQGANLFQ